MEHSGPSWKKMLGLSVVVVGLLCTGAWVFSAIEGEPELERRRELRKVLNDFLENHTCVNAAGLHELLDSIDFEVNFARRMLQNKTVYTQWDFAGSFSFAITVVTTIGYGNLAPRTGWGRIAVVIFAFIGIPITMIMITSIGHVLSNLSSKVNRCNLCSAKPMVNKVLNMVLIIAMGITILFALPAFIFNIVEKWSILEGLYFCFVTLSTIGFGDYIAAFSENRLSDKGAGDLYRVVTYVWILFGLSYLSLVISYITDAFIRKAEEVEQLTRDLTKDRFGTEIGRLQEEITKRKQTVVKKATDVKSTVKEKASRGWETPRGDAITSHPSFENKNGVQLLRVKAISSSNSALNHV